MSRKTFHDLLERYLKGQCTAEEQEIVRHWYDLLDSDEHMDLNDVVLEELEGRLWTKISAETLPISGKKKDHSKIFSITKPWYTAIAAAIVLIIISVLWVNRRLCDNPVDPEFVVTKTRSVSVVKNVKSAPMEFFLPDSSKVKLFKGAQISYPTKFDSREIVLIGDALFDVTANPSQPFSVFHEGMITRVLGTCFLIKSGLSTGNDEVIVYSGKVEVIRSAKRNSIIERIIEKPLAVKLTMNQRAVLNEKENTLRETLAEVPIPIEAKQKLLKEVAFKEIDLADLTKRLSDLYGIAINVEPAAKKITFTGDLSDMELFNQLNIICNVTETTYRVEGKTIIIHNKHKPNPKHMNTT